MKDLREAYDLLYQAEYEQADYDLCGRLFSRKGHESRFTERQLWQLPPHEAAAMASDEMLEWWRLNTHTTWADYREQALRELPWGTVEADPRPVTYWWAKLTVPANGLVVTCECQWGHMTPEIALKCARKLAAERGLKLAA
jgi:hypothetical protein